MYEFTKVLHQLEYTEYTNSVSLVKFFRSDCGLAYYRSITSA